jgi:hypothetical protein
MKTLLKIIIWLITCFSFLNPAFADADNLQNGWWPENTITNSYLEDLQNTVTDFGIESWWSEWIRNVMFRIARDIKNLFVLFAWIYFLVIVIRLLFSGKTEEEVWNFKKWIIWISVWIIVVQIAYYFVSVLFDQGIDASLARSFINSILNPIIKLLETSASFLFIAIMIFAFYRIITANWDEEKTKTWKMSVLYAAIWFIVIKISRNLIGSLYWSASCSNTFICTGSTQTTNISWFAEIVVKIINWMNSFVSILTIILIIYAGFLLIISWWDEEKLKKAKSSIIYIIIWLIILVTNYLILTFFILPESNI